MKCKGNCFKVLLFGCVLIFLSFFSNVSAEIPDYTKEFYVNDFADVISEENEDYILQNSEVLADKIRAQVVVATVKSLDGRPIDDYAVEMFRQWSIGSKPENTGVLILLAPNEREIKIEVGYGLEGKINDSKAGRLIDEYAIPCFKNDDWDGGICALYSAVLSEVYSEYGLEMPQEVSNRVSDYNETRDNSHMSTIMSIIIVAIIILFGGVLPVVLRKNRPYLSGRSDDWDDWNDWNNGGGFGGGFGGFNSGGSGGFGGSSGGGGASRKF